MSSNRCTRGFGPVGRPLLALGLAAALAIAAFGPAAPARAEDEPVARLQVVLKSVHVVDDGDWIGQGELKLWFVVASYKDGCVDPAPYTDNPPTCSGAQGFLAQRWAFSADDDDDLAFNEAIPGGKTQFSQFAYPVASAEAGIDAHRGETLLLIIAADESDSSLQDFLRFGSEFEHGGTTDHHRVLREQDGWNLGAGTAKLPANYAPGSGDFDIRVEYEVRRAPLPDLVPQSVQGQLLDDGRPVVCASVTNAGERESGSFQMVLRADGADVPGGTFEGYSLAVGESLPHCFLVPAGQHRYALSVDEPRQVAEINEYNNVLEEQVALRLTAPLGPLGPLGPAGLAPESPGGVNPPSAAQADLAVDAIRMKGKDPSGNNDCDPGKNDVTVLVKNVGPGAATSFAVRVVADNEDDEAAEKTGLNLDAGKEFEVRFDDLRLRKGDHKLVATADARKAVAESDEDNNELTVTVQCKDEGD